METMEEIPVLSLWKMFTGTIPILSRVEAPEGSVNRIANLILYEDSSNIFVYEYGSTNQTCENYQQILNQYKSFTTWFLGRFFYLLCTEKLAKSHNVIVESQLRILDQLSKSKLCVYEEMAREYCNIMHRLTTFKDDMTLEVFVPEKLDCIDLSHAPIEVNLQNCEGILLKVLKLVKYIVLNDFDYQSFSEQTFDDFVVLLSKGSFRLKLEIMAIYIALIEKNQPYGDCPKITRKLDLLSAFFEQVTYRLYDNEEDLGLKKQDFENFENCLLPIFVNNSNNGSKASKICTFLLTRAVEGGQYSTKILDLCRRKAGDKFFQTVTGYEQFVNNQLKSYNTLLLCGLQKQIMSDIDEHFQKHEGPNTSINLCEISPRWNILYDSILRNLSTSQCNAHSCTTYNFLNFVDQLSSEIASINFLISRTDDSHSRTRVLFFKDEALLFSKFMCNLNSHLHSEECDGQLDCMSPLLHSFFLNFPLMCSTQNLSFFFTLLVFNIVSESVPIKNINFTTSGSLRNSIKKEVGEFLTLFLQQLSGDSSRNRLECLDLVCQFMDQVRCERVFFNENVGNGRDGQVQEMEKLFLKTCGMIFVDGDEKLCCRLVESVPSALLLFPRKNEILSQTIETAFVSSNTETLKQVTRILPELLCITSSNFEQELYLNEENKLKIKNSCQKCDIGYKTNNAHQQVQIDSISQFQGTTLKNLLKFLSDNDSELKSLTLEALVNCSNHISAPRFFSTYVTKVWVEKAMSSDDDGVRRTLAGVLPQILNNLASNCDNNEMISQTLDTVFTNLTKTAKKSLQLSDKNLQETVLETVDIVCGRISPLLLDKIEVPIVKILIYMVMVPTSSQQFVAANKIIKFSTRCDITPSQLYKRHKQEICGTVVHLCAINQAAAGYDLNTSLAKLSMTFDFYNPRDFVIRECQHLLPFFVSKINGMEKVAKLLIEQVATISDCDVAELLAGAYGSIFIHVFLNCNKEEFKRCMSYVEKTTGMSGATLRKNCLRVILNELLLNFHEKKDQVQMALALVATDELGSRPDDLQNFLQAHLLGLLQHFDFKLMGINSNPDRKRLILWSLADLFRYMGPKHVGPLRYKIIAMLRTADFGDIIPEMSCEVWKSFVTSCDAEDLGAQMATILVSIMPLMHTCPQKINEILRYLLVENEKHTKDYVKDLFFMSVDEYLELDSSVAQIIRKYKKKENLSLRDEISACLRYLTHETIEVRIASLKNLKVIMENSREELDKMILGYNGIDPVIVDLIDHLTLGCREKDKTLRAACGEVIGELGAVEPAHLPRRYRAENGRPFTFSMEDDAFIENSLNELIKALQAEKNTINIDRFAVAIQEYLKTYDISPETKSSRNHLWKQFAESQQQVMSPLLNSRYIIAQPKKVAFPSPIYGSPEATSYHLWLYGWTLSLIYTLRKDHQTLLTACLPAMKHNKKIIMNFLPYVVLHSLIEKSDDAKERCFTEISAVTNCLGASQLNPEMYDIRPFATANKSRTSETTTPEEVNQTLCTKTVFIVLDFLDRWIREWQWHKEVVGRNDANFLNIKGFLSRFCKLQLAKCNFHCGEYPRALMYLEDYMSENPKEISSQLYFLSEIYAQLDEADGVAGVTALQQTEPTIQQRILAHEVSGKLSDAASCYERIPHPYTLAQIKGLVHCYLDLDNVNTALNFVKGAMETEYLKYEGFNKDGDELWTLAAEPLWRLGRFEELEDLISKRTIETHNNWGVEIGRALLSFRKKDWAPFERALDGLRLGQVDALGAASVEEGAYQHGYCYISKLHALGELQQVEKMIKRIVTQPNDRHLIKELISNLSKEWKLRIKVVQESVRILEPLLCLRRVAIEQAKNVLKDRVPTAGSLLDSLLGELWLLSAKTARLSGVHQQAYSYTLKAEEFAPPDFFIEKAKLHWAKEEHEQAFITLKRGLDAVLPDTSKEAIAQLPVEKKQLCAEARLLFASYNDSLSNVDTEVIMQYYRDAVDVCRENEKSNLSLGQFHDRLFQTHNEQEQDEKCSDIQLHMINYFGRSLLWGTTYVYQSMPRLLSIWFDYGTRLLNVVDHKVHEERKGKLLKMTKLIDNYLERLPVYVFLTAFSQLVSRITHPQKEVYIELKSIIIKLLLHYPQQTLWMMTSVFKSGHPARVKRCNEIFHDPQLKTPSMVKFIGDFSELAEKLIELCNKEVPDDVDTTTVSQLVRNLPRLLSKSDFSEIMIPTHKFRKLVLPNPDFSSSQHNPFPNHYVHIVGIEERVSVLRSLQKPRRISFRGSDGKGYIQMLKPKDDLRRDFRLMEFNDIVNQLLSREPEARQRRLNIRLYSVAPLNEECGIIEWVPNMITLRGILLQLYRQRGLGISGREMKSNSCKKTEPMAKKRDVFQKIFLARHPPVLGDWFRRTFPDAQSWVFARTAYIRTTAVVSMVGYVLGLGDRHGENILLDSTCGDTMHVDFNCLFNKGESFEYPEKVPFRLTQNMVAAMGPLGVEGPFRKSCACTLSVLRDNAATLMSIVTPFVYDPLVSWRRNTTAMTQVTAEKTNDQALIHVKDIELRLKGIGKTNGKYFTNSLSVDGQTNYLINEAVSLNNLCQMYVGWAPYH